MTCLFEGMPFYFAGAGSPSKLQGKPIKYLFLDEVRNYPAGAIELALKRVRSYETSGYKVFIISTPSEAGDDVDTHFKLGSQHVWHIKCPQCEAWQPLLFERMKWDVNEHTKPDGMWNFDRLAVTIRLHCASCLHVWRDTAADRRQLTGQGKYIQGNPNAPRSVRSYTWNALLPEWVKWRKIVQEYLAAVQAVQSDVPDLEPLKSFYCETLGMSWEEALGIVEDYDFLKDRHGDYDFDDPWPDEIVRFMAADRQEKGGEHYWWVVRAFARGGRSRLVGYGRAETTEQLEELREQYGVPLANAMMDSGHETQSVYRFCMKSGWKPFKGDQVPFYTVSAIDPETRKPKPMRRIWVKSQVDPIYGTKGAGKTSRMKIGLFRFSSESAKDYLAEMMRGLVGEWTVPRKIGTDYLQQMTAEARLAVVDAFGKIKYVWKRKRKDNHCWDCEQMILIAAIVTKLIQGGAIRVPKTVKVTEPVTVDG